MWDYKQNLSNPNITQKKQTKYTQTGTDQNHIQSRL